MHKFILAIVVLGVVLFAGVAFAQSSSTPTASSPCASPAASPAVTMVASPAAAATPASCGTLVASAAGPTVNLVDISFDPKELTIPANTDVTIMVVNQGATVHNLNIDALKVQSGDVDPGAKTSVKINAKAGDYEYYCNIPGHKAAGMVGTLHVK